MLLHNESLGQGCQTHGVTALSCDVSQFFPFANPSVCVASAWHIPPTGHEFHSPGLGYKLPKLKIYLVVFSVRKYSLWRIKLDWILNSGFMRLFIQKEKGHFFLPCFRKPKGFVPECERDQVTNSAWSVNNFLKANKEKQESGLFKRLPPTCLV